jgi:hypothetical protein
LRLPVHLAEDKQKLMDLLCRLLVKLLNGPTEFFA